MEKRLRYKRVGPFGEKEKARLNSLLSELSEISIAVTKAGAKVPELSSLEKLVPILKTLAEVSVVSDSQENLAATGNVFSSLPSALKSNSFGSSTGLCNGHPCYVNPSAGYPIQLRTYPTSAYQPRRFVQL